MPRNLLKEQRDMDRSLQAENFSSRSVSKRPPRNLLQEKRNQEMAQKKQSPGMLSSIATGIGNLGTGIVEGSAQSLYDMAKSAGNLGLSAYDALNPYQLNYSLNDSEFDEWQAARDPSTNQGGQPIRGPMDVMQTPEGASGARIPQMQIAQRNPESSARSFGQAVGGIAAPAVLSAYSGQFAVPAAEAAASSMGLSGSANPISMMIARALGAGAGGAAEGYVTGSEENRAGSALMGGLSAGVFQVGSDALKTLSSSISKNVENKVTKLKDLYGKEFQSVLESGENAGANKFLKPINKSTINSFKDSTHTKAYNTLSEYNKNPTLINAHKAQAELARVARISEKSGNKMSENAIKAQNHLMVQIGEAFEKSGAKDALNGYQILRKEYAENVVPYIDSKAVKALINKELRPHKFAGEILKEQDFLAKAGKSHPDLMLRESLSDIGNSKIGQAALGIGGLAAAQASGLPYHIQKYFK